MGKIIIENRTNIDDHEAIQMVASVIRAGRISNDGKQYSYATNFKSFDASVYTDLNKKSDRFVICSNRHQDNEK